MRHPVGFQFTVSLPFRRRNLIPRAGYDRPRPLRCYPGQFYNQGCMWASWGPLRVSVVWSNP